MRPFADQGWLLESPELLNLAEELSCEKLSGELTANKTFHGKKTHRLGVYFEQLWASILANSDNVKQLKINLQVIVEKQTLGEFDSIFDYRNITTHCELAVKFYLKVGSKGSLSDWVGPNLKDRFDDKYKRLFQHQLSLDSNPLVFRWLQKKNIVIEHKKLLCKGRLFYPYQDFVENRFEYPNEVAEKHLKGFWVHYSELKNLISDEQYQWYQLPRFYWLAEIESIDEDLLPVELEFDGFSLQKIVALKDGEEAMRGFVVNDDWLHKAQQRVMD